MKKKPTIQFVSDDDLPKPPQPKKLITDPSIIDRDRDEA